MSRGVTMKTPERVAQAAAMRARGMKWREIAAHFGISTSAAADWVNDPDLSRSRARKDSYAAPCIDCGAPTSGCDGRRAEPRCHPCAAARCGDEKKIWTRAALILAIQEWAAEYGEPPATADWQSFRARAMGDEDRARRYRRLRADGVCPCFTTVIDEFGTWNAAIAAAGFTPRADHGGGGNQHRKRSANGTRP